MGRVDLLDGLISVAIEDLLGLAMPITVVEASGAGE